MFFINSRSRRPAPALAGPPSSLPAGESGAFQTHNWALWLQLRQHQQRCFEQRRHHPPAPPRKLGRRYPGPSWAQTQTFAAGASDLAAAAAAGGSKDGGSPGFHSLHWGPTRRRHHHYHHPCWWEPGAAKRGGSTRAAAACGRHEQSIPQLQQQQQQKQQHRWRPSQPHAHPPLGHHSRCRSRAKGRHAAGFAPRSPHCRPCCQQQQGCLSPGGAPTLCAL